MDKTLQLLIVCILILGCVATGVYLVVNNHPWFGLLAMIIGGSVSYKG